MKDPQQFKEKLDKLVEDYGGEFLDSDPLRFPHRYADAADTEVAALIAAVFAYGNVIAMAGFLSGLFANLGPRPALALKQGDLRGGWRSYRFQTAAEVGRFLDGVGRVLREHGSLEACFQRVEGDAEARLEAFSLSLREASAPVTTGLRHLLPLPSSGSACKRWWMFLRWTCRPDDGVDLGLWTCVAPAELRLPVDTHVARIARCLGLSRRASPDRRFAVEATERLRLLCPEDPVKYDFALARLGILGVCPPTGGASAPDACPLGLPCARARRS